MHVEIITPDETYFDGEAESVKVPGASGSFEILNLHAPIISALSSGKIEVKVKDEDPKFFEIQQGFIECQNNKIVILV